jgi:hypothetical protein
LSFSSEDESFFGQISHDIQVHVGDMDGMMEVGVVKFDVHGVLRIVVDTLDNANRVPNHETSLEMNRR